MDLTCHCAVDVTTLGPFYFHYRYSRGPQVASEPDSVAAGPLYTGTPHGAETLRPRDEALVTLRGLVGTVNSPRRLPNWSKATAPRAARGACPRPKLPRLRRPSPLCHSSSRPSLPFRRRGHFWPDDMENGRYCDGSFHRQAPMKSRSGLGRLQDGAEDQPTGRSQGIFGPRCYGESGRSEASPATTYSVFTVL